MFLILISDYANATFDNYVSGQGVNEVLAEAQTIICALSRMGTEDLAGDGSYKATIYINECEQAAAQATDSTQGTTAPSSATNSSTSSATATAQLVMLHLKLILFLLIQVLQLLICKLQRVG